MSKQVLKGAALSALILAGATGAAQASTTYAFDFVHGDPNLSFHPTGVTFARYQNGELQLGKPQGSVPNDEVYVIADFTIGGDFTATATVDLGAMNPVCNICGNQVTAFMAMGTGGHGEYVGTIADENGEGAETVFDNNFQGYGFLPMTFWQITRVGDTITTSFLNGGGQVLASRSVSGADYAGAAGLAFEYGDFHNNGSAGFAGFSNVTITADSFRGLVTTNAAAPEPGAWALMIAGFGLAGTALRRRRAVEA